MSEATRDGSEMLEQIIPQRELRDLTARILADQGRCYREQFIDTVQPIPGTHELIQEIRRLGIRVAAISSCQRDELATSVGAAMVGGKKL